MAFAYDITVGGTSLTTDNIIAANFSQRVDQPWVVLRIEIPLAVIDDYSVDVGSAVVMTYGVAPTTNTYYGFRGTVEAIEPRTSSAILTCYDKLYQLTKRTINESYTLSDAFAGSISAIATDMIETYGGLTADATTIDDTGSITLISSLICLDANCWDRVKNLLGTVLYYVYYNPQDDKVYAHLRGKNSCSDNFEVSVNIVGKPQWSYDGTNIVNHLRLYGDTRTVTTTELFNGDGAELHFQLSNVPDKASNIYVEVGGVEKNFGQSGVDASYDYTLDIDPKRRYVTFEAASVPGAGVNNVSVTYSYVNTLFTERWDAVSAANYPSADGGYRERAIINGRIVTIDDLENTASAIMSVAPYPYETVSFVGVNLTKVPKILEKLHINDTINSKDQDMNIVSVSWTYPNQSFSITAEQTTGKIEDYLYSPEQRITILEESSRGNQTMIIQSIQNTPIVDVSVSQILSEFNAFDDDWNTAEKWDTASTWGANLYADDFSIDFLSTHWIAGTGTWTVTGGILTGAA